MFEVKKNCILNAVELFLLIWILIVYDLLKEKTQGSHLKKDQLLSLFLRNADLAT